MFGVFVISQPLFTWLGVEMLRPGLPEGLNDAEIRQELLKTVLPLVVLLSHATGWAALLGLIMLRYRMTLAAGLALQGLGGFRGVVIVVGGMLLQWVGRLSTEMIQSSEGIQNQTSRFLALGGWAVAVMFVVAAVMAPLLEESIFRGVLQPALRRRLSFPLTALVVTAVFTALHLNQFLDYPPALAVIFVCGWVLAWLRDASGSLWPPILFHFGFNFAAVLPVIFFYDTIVRGIPALG